MTQFVAGSAWECAAAANGNGKVHMTDIRTATETAIALRSLGFWSHLVYSGKKRPIGNGWGKDPWSEDKIRDTAGRHPGCGVGVCLGPGRAPGGKWLIDVEGDGPAAEDSRATLFAGEEVETMGYPSARGYHQLLTADGDRLKPTLSKLKGCESKDGAHPGVYHLPNLPDLELRIGGFKDDGKTVKQVQSIVPPTVGTDDKPRVWNGVEAIAEAPEAFYQALELIASYAEEVDVRKNTANAGSVGRTRASGGAALDAYGRAALEAECEAVAGTGEGNRNIQLNLSAFKVGRLVGARAIDKGAAEEALSAAGRQCGLSGQEIDQTIRGAMAAGIDAPRDLSHVGQAREKTKAADDKGTRKQATDEPAQEINYQALSEEDMGLFRADDIEDRPVRWAWKYRLAFGSAAMVAAEGGLGKTMLVLYFAALMTKGSEWPDGSGDAPMGKVIILSAEDKAEDTLKPRMRAMGADLSKVVFLKARVIIKRPGKEPLVHYQSFKDLAYWQDIMRRVPDCVMLAVDSLPAYLGRGVNDHRNNEVRAVMEPFLQTVIEPRECVLLCVSHLNKSVDAKTPQNRILGSVAYSNLPRNVHVVFKDQENQGRRFFGQVKCNNAPDDMPSIAFKVEQTTVNVKGVDIETAIPVFEGETVDIDLRAAMSGNGQPKRRGPDPEETRKRAEWLHDFLSMASGPVPVAAIFDAAGDKGFVGSKQENGKWSSPNGLYRAKDAVAGLAEHRKGRQVIDLKKPAKPGGRDVVHWDLVDATKPTNA